MANQISQQWSETGTVMFLGQLGHVVGEVLDRAAVHEGEERGQQRQQGLAARVGSGGHWDRAE